MAMSEHERELAGAAWAIILFLAVFGTGAGLFLWLVIEFLSAL
jgi:hypothetical protein